MGKITGGHRGLRNLFSITVYVFIVMSGWYGQILIPWFVNWFILAIILGMVLFILQVVYFPGRAGMKTDVASGLGSLFGSPSTKSKIKQKAEELEDRLETLERQFVRARTETERARLEAEIDETKLLIRKLREEL